MVLSNSYQRLNITIIIFITNIFSIKIILSYLLLSPFPCRGFLSIFIISSKPSNNYSPLTQQINKQIKKQEMRSSLGTIPSQKSTTIQTQVSRPNGVKVYYLPATTSNQQKRFARKNTSIQKKNNRSTNSINEGCSSIKNLSRKNSQKLCEDDKINASSPSYVKLANFIKSGSTLSHNKSTGELKPLSKTFREADNKENSRKILQKTLRISEQKVNSKYERDSLRSVDSYKESAKGKNFRMLQVELQLREKQISKLQDERRKFRNMYEDIKRKQTKMKQQFDAHKNQQNNTIKQKQKSINKLQEELKKQKNIIEAMKLKQNRIVEEYKKCERQKENVVKQLNQIIQRKIPKNVLQLQSWKQASLREQINELKKEMNISKTDIELDMENIIRTLQIEKNYARQELKKVQIANRLLLQKLSESQKYFESYNIMKNEYTNIRLTLKELKQECEYLRKQNIRIKKQRNNQSKKQTHRKESKSQTFHLRVPSETESLSFSVHSRQ